MAANFTNMSTLTNAQLTSFNDTYIMLAADTKDNVTDLFSPEPNFKGEEIFVHTIGTAGAAKKQTSEHEIAEPTVYPHYRRIMYPNSYYERVLLPDGFTQWKMIADPRGAYQQRIQQAMNVKRRTEALASIFADVSVETSDALGNKSVTTSSFPAANKVAYNFSSGAFAQTNQGLSIDKLNEIKKKMFANHVSPMDGMGETINVLVDADTWFKFLAESVLVDTTEKIYPHLQMSALTNKPDFMPGMEVDMLGFKFRFVHDLPTSGSDTLVPVFLNSGMRKGRVIKPMYAFRDPQRVDTNVIQVQEYNGFLRVEDEKVYQIAVR